MRRTGLLLVFVTILWGSFWWITTQNMENSVKEWFEQKTLEEYRDYEKISISGFPNRADVTIENINIINSRAEIAISAKLIQVLKLIYNKSAMINIIEPPININFKTKNLTIDGDIIRTSIKFDSKSQVSELVAEGKKLHLEDFNKHKLLYGPAIKLTLTLTIYAFQKLI